LHCQYSYSWLGCMKNTGKIIGDIISPTEDEDKDLMGSFGFG